jgi:hypothetical protein
MVVLSAYKSGVNDETDVGQYRGQSGKDEIWSKK